MISLYMFYFITACVMFPLLKRSAEEYVEDNVGIDFPALTVLAAALASVFWFPVLAYESLRILFEKEEDMK